MFEHGANYVCSKAVPTAAQAVPSCDFKSGQIILQQPIEREQMSKLLATGKTDLLEKFVSNRTRRNFKAFLAWDEDAGKVNFEFEQRESKYPARKTAAATKTAAAGAAKTGAAAKKAPAAKKAAAAKKTTARKPAAANLPARCGAGRRDRRRRRGAHRGGRESLGLRQGPQPARPRGQARDRGRCQAACPCSARTGSACSS